MTYKNPNIFVRAASGLWRAFDGFGRFVLNLLMLLLAIVVISSLMSGDDIKVPKDAALVLAPTGNIVEQLDQVNPFDDALDLGSRGKQTLLQDLLDAIENAKEDNRIKGIVLSTRNMGGATMTQLQIIGKALEDFKTSGKKIYAYGDLFGQGQYYLAAHADEVYVNDKGGVSIDGFGRFRTYFKGLFDKIGINYHIFKVGKFKSAIEPYIRKGMSDEAKEANLAFLNDLWSAFKADVATQRGFEPTEIDNVADNALALLQQAEGNAATMALNTKLVDGIKSRVAMKDYLVEIFGENEDKNSYKAISHKKYLEAIRPPIEIDNGDKAKVALIIAKGAIMDGSQKEGTIGGDSLAKLIRKARDNEKVKALVLRVDSPGGSAFASEVIRQELLKTKEVGKPVVVSMGSYAASGGYWISANADQIWASPTTITGSIGVFGMIPTFEKPVNEYLEVYRDGVGTNKLTGGLDPLSGIDPDIKGIIQMGVDEIYDSFLTLVAEGRNMTKEAVHEIAQGRVWSGKKALELGLVDQLGDLEEATKAAAELAKLEDFEVKEIKRELTPKEQFLKEFMKTSVATWFAPDTVSESRPSAVKQLLNQAQEQLEYHAQFNDPNYIYTHCFCDVN